VLVAAWLRLSSDAWRSDQHGAQVEGNGTNTVGTIGIGPSIVIVHNAYVFPDHEGVTGTIIDVFHLETAAVVLTAKNTVATIRTHQPITS
jgi:hypothetical protein